MKEHEKRKPKKKKMDIINLKKQPAVAGAAAIVGKKEHNGPLGMYFQGHDDDDMFSQKTFEKAEGEMVRRSMYTAMKSCGVKSEQIGALFGGDLMNQCTASAYGLSELDIPYFGIYGACSSLAEGLILASLCMQTPSLAKTAVCVSSHNCTAERQFRSPLEYGGQRSPSSQWTATAAGSVILSDGEGDAYITQVLPGRCIGSGITDMSNMGAAMARAAYDTLSRFFRESKLGKEDFDLILTGDLGGVGHRIVYDFLCADGIDLGEKYNDCGLLLYDTKNDDVHSGGSGCGCSAAVFCGYIMSKFKEKMLNNVLLVCTGALMSPLTVNQGEEIMGIAHLVRLSSWRM